VPLFLPKIVNVAVEISTDILKFMFKRDIHVTSGCALVGEFNCNFVSHYAKMARDPNKDYL
jgi:hypothetical protein